MVCMHISAISAQEDILIRTGRAAEVTLASCNRPILGLGLETTLRCLNSQCTSTNVLNVYVCIQCTYASCHNIVDLNTTVPQAKSDMKHASIRQSHLYRHFMNSGHFIFLSVEHLHLYCAQCNDFVFDRYLDAVVATKARASRASRTRLTSTASPLEMALHKRPLGDEGLSRTLPKRRRLLYSDHWMPSEKELRCITTQAKVFSSPEVETRPPIGLLNLGNSCYMNSVLQAFFNAPPLRQFFLADEHKPFCAVRKATGCLACAIDRIICDSCFCLDSEMEWAEASLSSSLKIPFLVPRDILDIMWRNAAHLASYAQHDAHEFLIAALNILNTHCRTDKAADDDLKLRNPKRVSSKDSELHTLVPRTGLYSGSRRKESPISPISNVRAENNGGFLGHSENAVQSATSIIQNLFSGTLQSDVICRVCGNSSLTLEKFYDISLDVDKVVKGSSARRSRGQSPTCGVPVAESPIAGWKAVQGGSFERSKKEQLKEENEEPFVSDVNAITNDSPGKVLSGHDSHQGRDTVTTNTLEDCLSRFTEPELLGSSSKMHCGRCEKRQESMKQMSIRTLPPIVCFHFKRFERSFANVRRSEMLKINTPVEFPADGLDLSAFQTSSVLRRREGTRKTANSSIMDSPIFTALQRKLPGSNCEEDREDNHIVRGSGDAIYDLFAVVNHNGRIDSGHYTAMVRKRGTWFKCDDEKVTKLPALESTIRSKEAYLVFYAQRHPNVQFSSF